MELIFLFAFAGSIGVVAIYDKLSRMAEEKKKTDNKKRGCIESQSVEAMKKSA